MAVKYTLFMNYLTTDPDDYMARVASLGVVDEAQIIDDMLGMGTTLDRPDLEGTLRLYHRAIQQRLIGGFQVATPSSRYSLSLRGVFDGSEDSYDPARHQIDVAVNTGGELREFIRKNIDLEKDATREVTPQPKDYIDIASGDERNSILTPGGMGRLAGVFLKFDPTDEAQGVFFIQDGTATRVTQVGRNKPGELLFVVPDSLTAGDYTLEVRTSLSTPDDLKRGRLSHTLTVA